jgi:hypothetical protein
MILSWSKIDASEANDGGRLPADAMPMRDLFIITLVHSIITLIHCGLVSGCLGAQPLPIHLHERALCGACAHAADHPSAAADLSVAGSEAGSGAATPGSSGASICICISISISICICMHARASADDAECLRADLRRFVHRPTFTHTPSQVPRPPPPPSPFHP